MKLEIHKLEYVQPKPPLWARILTLGRIEYWHGWQIRMELRLAPNNKGMFLSSNPAKEPPNPRDVAGLTSAMITQATNDLLTDLKPTEKNQHEKTS